MLARGEQCSPRVGRRRELPRPTCLACTRRVFSKRRNKCPLWRVSDGGHSTQEAGATPRRSRRRRSRHHRSISAHCDRTALLMGLRGHSHDPRAAGRARDPPPAVEAHKGGAKVCRRWHLGHPCRSTLPAALHSLREGGREAARINHIGPRERDTALHGVMETPTHTACSLSATHETRPPTEPFSCPVTCCISSILRRVPPLPRTSTALKRRAP